MLQVQLASLFHSVSFTSALHTTISVCHDPDDQNTVDVIAVFQKQLRNQFKYLSSNLAIKSVELEKKNLFQRSVGRNQVALGTSADVVWFTDCDYYFGGDALAAACRACRKQLGTCVYPSCVYTHFKHEMGDVLLRKLNKVDMPVWEIRAFRQEGEFVRRPMRKAIGGIQIIDGDYCREFGYLNGTKWVDSVAADHFLRCRSDAPFRRSVGSTKRVDIPDVFRIRHSRCGRDQGKNKHGASQ